MIVCAFVTNPSVAGRPVRNEPLFIGRHPFFVFSEAPESLRALTQILDVFQGRGLARKISKPSGLGAIILGIRLGTTFHLAACVSDSPRTNGLQKGLFPSISSVMLRYLRSNFLHTFAGASSPAT
jgi:hypothetical protein